MFDLIGETLRRLRKERGLTLDELGRAAELGRGQLSRIENNKQEATLSTLGKILTCQAVTRREFFRRYELVETEARAVKRQEKGEHAAEDSWPDEVREALGKVESLVQLTFNELRPVAQGAIEVGDLVVLFRVMPKDAAPPTPAKAKSDLPSSAPKGQDAKPGRKRKPSRG
jgi:transcriptional regulator with XRE-family HTH domain